MSLDKGKLVYSPDPQGNRIPDFSYCGYMASEQEIPMVEARVFVAARQGDATARIQAAIDFVGKLPVDENGFRGAVLLGPGKHDVLGQIRLDISGVVLRGSGIGLKGTELLGAGKDRETLLRITGKNDRKENLRLSVTDSYVPVNARIFQVTDGSSLLPGDQVFIGRPSSKEWIEALGTAHFGGGITSLGWKPGERDLYFDRKVVAVDGNRITIDAPITTALDTTYGGGYLIRHDWPGRIFRTGIENMTLTSAYDVSLPKDEDHRWMAITIEHAQDVWIRQVSFRHFAGSAVMVLHTAKRVTVEDCISQDPVSEIGGERRNSFFTEGQQVLFQRCIAYDGNHDFATGHCNAGPVAFVQCESVLPHQFSGAIGSWSSGILFDMVHIDGQALRFGNRGQDGNGVGWAAANSLFWNCSAARIDCYRPPTAQNWAFGSWSQFAGDGHWAESNNTIHPGSFFYAQLSERLGKQMDGRAQLLRIGTDASSSPTVPVALALTKEASEARPTLKDWILAAAVRHPLPVKTPGLPSIDDIGYATPLAPVKAPPLKVMNGLILRGGELQAGRRMDIPWWSGGIHGKDLLQAKPAITRFVPGRTGSGLTDDLQVLAAGMKASNTIGIEQHHGLWYDRRRDDHQRVRRMDGDVWAPFYEMPFARSGQGIAWDGLSKYDLTRYNHWYWNRMRRFADLADQEGLLLVHKHYFQHNIIEAGAHFADFPWRTANNINAVGFPEPVHYAGDKRVFMAGQFYDTTDVVRRKIHQKYIWQCLDNVKSNTGVIHLIGEEFTGPLHFVQFWIDAVRSWESKNRQAQLIGLSTTKEVQDAILADPVRGGIVDIIDIRYWHYQQDGAPYAPQGGQHLAPRQHARLLKPKRSSFTQVHRAVSEYRLRYPGKAVIYSADSDLSSGWAVLLGGGSLPVLPATTDKTLLSAVATLRPDTIVSRFALSGNGQICAGFVDDTERMLDLTRFPGVFSVRYVDLRTGKLLPEEDELQGGRRISVRLPEGAGMVWLRKKVK